MSAPKCTSWLGHHFVARYSTSPRNLLPKQMEELFWLGHTERVQLTRPQRTYECDVCARCGHVVQLPQDRDKTP